MQENCDNPSSFWPLIAPSMSFGPDYTFAYNVRHLSDLVLRINIVDDDLEARNIVCRSSSILEADANKHSEYLGDPDKQRNHIDELCLDKGALYESNAECEAYSMRVKHIYMNTEILGSKSPFFYKLFDDGVKGSEVALAIKSSEEEAFMDLLHFIHSNTLRSSGVHALIDVIRIAIKFEVPNCVTHALQILGNLDSACCSKGFYQELINLSLAEFKALLVNDNFRVPSEDYIFDLVMRYVHTHYPTIEERHKVLGAGLGHVIRFPFMSIHKLKDVLTCPDLDLKSTTKALEAFFFKSQMPNQLPSLADCNTLNCPFSQRAYTCLPVTVMEFNLSQPRCAVFVDLKRDDCANLFPSGRVRTQDFLFNGHNFFLFARCDVDQQNRFQCFSLFLRVHEVRDNEACCIDYTFSVRTNPSEDFEDKKKATHLFMPQNSVNGSLNLVNILWTELMACESRYFIGDSLRLKIELKTR